MQDLAEAYDLGDVNSPTVARPRRAPYAPSADAVRKIAAAHRGSGRLGESGVYFSGTLSLFLPGAGQLWLRRPSTGLFFLSSLGFLAALGWALLGTFDRLQPTLALLEVPIGYAFALLVLAYLAAAGLHVAAVLDASRGAGRASPPPFVPGLASALLPGWGQLINGDRLRSALFLGGVWLVAGVWILGSERATEFLNGYLPVVTTWEQTVRSPLVAWTARWTLPALLWSLAVYDATSSAASRR